MVGITGGHWMPPMLPPIMGVCNTPCDAPMLLFDRVKLPKFSFGVRLNSFRLLKVTKDWLGTDSLPESLSLDPEIGPRVSPDLELGSRVTGSPGKKLKNRLLYNSVNYFLKINLNVIKWCKKEEYA